MVFTTVDDKNVKLAKNTSETKILSLGPSRNVPSSYKIGKKEYSSNQSRNNEMIHSQATSR
jgi:hypothetical protein